MNILSLVSQNLDNFYQIQTKCYRNSDTMFFSPIHRTKRGLGKEMNSSKEINAHVSPKWPDMWARRGREQTANGKWKGEGAVEEGRRSIQGQIRWPKNSCDAKQWITRARYSFSVVFGPAFLVLKFLGVVPSLHPHQASATQLVVMFSLSLPFGVEGLCPYRAPNFY
jgi:hypothetical protein